MTLKNLLEIGQLVEHETNADQVAKMLSSAERSFHDAHQTSISLETRFDAAYRTIMQLAMLGLWMNGYRPPKNRPGHHVTMIQSLPKTIGLDNANMLILDTFRIKRNAADYTGEEIDEASVEACITSADNLRKHIIAWLSEYRQDLM